jgi:predicted HAD superfamily Cof-like phosphohydrolase
VNFKYLIREFHFKFGIPIRNFPSLDLLEPAKERLKHIREEVDELDKGLAEKDLVQIADALGDIVYLCYGMSLQLGIPLTTIINEIHRTNMNKERTETPDHKYGIRKPPGWEGPRIAELLDVFDFGGDKS